MTSVKLITEVNLFYENGLDECATVHTLANHVDGLFLRYSLIVQFKDYGSGSTKENFQYNCLIDHKQFVDLLRLSYKRDDLNQYVFN